MTRTILDGTLIEWAAPFVLERRRTGRSGRLLGHGTWATTVRVELRVPTR